MSEAPLLQFRIVWNENIYPRYALEVHKYFLGFIPYWSNVADSNFQWELVEMAEALSKPDIRNWAG